MPYKEALEAAGAIVTHYKEFGTYQGDWFAAVIYRDISGIVSGSFGSCNACDAFSIEFNVVYSQDDTPEEYQSRLVSFGERYLNNITSIDEAIRHASENIEWDLEASDMVAWLVSIKNEEFNKKLCEVLDLDSPLITGKVHPKRDELNPDEPHLCSNDWDNWDDAWFKVETDNLFKGLKKK